MKISIRVKPNSKAVSVEKAGDGSYVVRVKAPPKEGRANDAVIEALSEHFGVPKSRVAIAGGRTGRKKVVEIT